MENKLPVHEWLIVVLLIAVLASIISITSFKSRFSSSSTQSVHYILSPTIQVHVEGAVQRPGVFTLNRGSRLQDVLELAGPLPEANIKSLKRNKVLQDGQVVTISPKKMITIFLEGLVESPGPVEVLEGTQVQDLLQQITFLPQADLKALKKKRQLKDQEMIYVTSKVSKKREKKAARHITKQKKPKKSTHIALKM